MEHGKAKTILTENAVPSVFPQTHLPVVKRSRTEGSMEREASTLTADLPPAKRTRNEKHQAPSTDGVEASGALYQEVSDQSHVVLFVCLQRQHKGVEALVAV